MADNEDIRPWIQVGEAVPKVGEACSEAVEALSAKIQKEAGLEYPPTAFTIPFRLAMSGEGDRAHEWEDKPHRLIYDLCEELERIAVKPLRG